MYSYRAPLRDIRFVVHEVLDFEQNYRAYGRDDLNRDLLEGILDEGARFAEDVLAPTNRVGDEHGLMFENGAGQDAARLQGSLRPLLRRTAGSP